MRNRAARPRPLPAINPVCVAELQQLRAGYMATANALRLISVLSDSKRGRSQPRLASALTAALQRIRDRHPTADFTWKIFRPRRDLKVNRSDTPDSGSLKAIARANIYVVPVQALSPPDCRLLAYAMAIGLPVIAPEPPANGARLFDHGVEGLFADYTDTVDLAAQLSRVLFDIDLRMRMTHAGQRRMGTVNAAAPNGF